jgi:hypothetical protein
MLLNILITFFLLPACDTKKYFSYNYDASEFKEVASFSGTVTNVFTGARVSNATVRIEDQSTTTNLQGIYRLDYLLSEDAKLNKAIDIEITARNYLPYTQTQSIFPGEFPLDVALEYGAPIILKTGCNDMTYCQAVIFDYQAANDIDSVTAHFQYFGNNHMITREIDVRLSRKENVSANVAHFQAIVQPFTPEGDSLGRAYWLKAFDREALYDSVMHINDLKRPDTLLFEPF